MVVVTSSFGGFLGPVAPRGGSSMIVCFSVSTLRDVVLRCSLWNLLGSRCGLFALVLTNHLGFSSEVGWLDSFAALPWTPSQQGEGYDLQPLV